jgi:hypothetical protein
LLKTQKLVQDLLVFALFNHRGHWSCSNLMASRSQDAVVIFTVHMQESWSVKRIFVSKASRC